jgi:hypothetical protein
MNWYIGITDAMSDHQAPTSGALDGTSCYCQREAFDTADVIDQSELPFAPTDTVLAVAGSRSFGINSTASELGDRVTDAINDIGITPDAIVSGGADGIDAGAEACAIDHDLPMVVCAVDGPSTGTTFRQRELATAPLVVKTVATYNDDGPGPAGSEAYLYRNCVLAELADIGLAIHDSTSRGTQHAIVSFRAHHRRPPAIKTFDA